MMLAMILSIWFLSAVCIYVIVRVGYGDGWTRANRFTTIGIALLAGTPGIFALLMAFLMFSILEFIEYLGKLVTTGKMADWFNTTVKW